MLTMLETREVRRKNMHPGAFLSGPRFTLDAIPMLHGSSGNRGPVVIKGLFAGDPNHPISPKERAGCENAA
ncbi:MAG: hypothetical protein R6X19_06930 [Kiritimatiellia bacterium]